jgi:hypothetical protein
MSIDLVGVPALPGILMPLLDLLLCRQRLVNAL